MWLMPQSIKDVQPPPLVKSLLAPTYVLISLLGQAATHLGLWCSHLLSGYVTHPTLEACEGH